MEKKGGSFMRKFVISIFLLLVSNYMSASSEVILSMQDMNHKPITQAMCQAPFILQVELRNLDGYTDTHLMQYITGIENFKSSRSMTSHNVSIDNGKKTIKTFYNFVLRSDKKGNFTVGPFILKDATGRPIRSNRLIVPVGDEIVLAEKNQKEKYFITMSLNKKQAYVGEKITLSVKFHDRLFVDDLHLQFPEMNNLVVVKNKNNSHKNMVVIDGEEYSVTEWLFDMYPTEPGTLIINDINAAFFAPELENRFKFGGSFDFFRSLHKTQQRIAAQPVKVDVLPLPYHKDFHKVTAVGQFSKFTIAANQQSASAGQGIVVTTELFGDGNFEMMESIPLVLPEDCKYYDSNMVTIDEKRSYKHCEFIVQAPTPGTYTITSQSLVYFDPVDAQYKKIQSNSLDITITQGAQLPQTLKTSDNLLDESSPLDEFVQKELQDFSVIQQGCVHAQSPVMIPLYWYKLFLWLLFLIWLFLCMYRNGLQHYVCNHRIWVKLVIFSRAMKAYKLALRQQNVHALHSIFIQLFAQLLRMNAGQLHQDNIIKYLVDQNFDDEQIQSWKNFNEQLLRASFASKLQVDQQDLFQQSLQWIQLLKDKA